MSISPISDVVLDVAMAADPVKHRAAIEKLATGSGVSRVERNGFGGVLNNTFASVPVSPNGPGIPSLAPSKLPKPPDAGTKAYKGLEQLILKNLLETLLPKNSSVLFGSSTAGEVWHSMLADQLAHELGKTVELGSARRNVVACSTGHRGAARDHLHISSSDLPADIRA